MKHIFFILIVSVSYLETFGNQLRCSVLMGASNSLLSSYNFRLQTLESTLIPILAQQMSSGGYAILPTGSLIPRHGADTLTSDLSDFYGLEIRELNWLRPNANDKESDNWIFENSSISPSRASKPEQVHRPPFSLKSARTKINALEDEIFSMKDIIEKLLNMSIKKEGFYLRISAVFARNSFGDRPVGRFHTDSLISSMPALRVGVSMSGSATLISRVERQPAIPQEIIIPNSGDIVVFTMGGANPTWHAGGPGSRVVIFFDANWISEN